MAENRAVRWHEHIGAHQYRLRIQNNNPYDNQQWFVFDQRTQSIRTWSNRKQVMSIQIGGTNWAHNGYAAVVRPFKGGFY
jgi:hypothetical protein